jgi:hypothetical protein
MMDSEIDTECAKANVKLIRPPFLRKKKQLSKEQATQMADMYCKSPSAC